ncbi:hypothetical protein FRC09_009847 [Ceratobasidium sp. 395]|nr:hypothetical protein FRC09_009847 [Ceratobasidium sp. 395]
MFTELRIMPSKPDNTRFGDPCTLDEISAFVYPPRKFAPPPTKHKLALMVNTSMTKYPAFGSIIKKLATLSPIKAKDMGAGRSLDISGTTNQLISSPEAYIGSSTQSPTSDSTVSTTNDLYVHSSPTVTSEDRTPNANGLDIEMDLSDFTLDELVLPDEHAYIAPAPASSRHSLPAKLVELPAPSPNISFEIVDDGPLETLDLADIRLNNLSIIEQLEPVFFPDINMEELDFPAFLASHSLDPDLNEFVCNAFALEPEETTLAPITGRFPAVESQMETEDTGTSSALPFEAGPLSQEHGCTHILGEERAMKSPITSGPPLSAASNTKLDTNMGIPNCSWTRWFPLMALAVLIGGPVFCLCLFFGWRCVLGLLAEPEPSCSVPQFDAANAEPKSVPNSNGAISKAIISAETSSSMDPHCPVGPLSRLQLQSDEANCTHATERTTNLAKKPQSKPLRSKAKLLNIQPLVATRAAPPRPYRGPPVPIVAVTPPDDGVIPEIFYYGPKVVHGSWSRPSLSHSPTPTNGRKRSNAVGEESRARVHALVAALPTTVPASILPFNAELSSRNACKDQTHRKSSSMSQWLEELVGANNPSVVVPRAELAKLAFVLRSPSSSPESTPPTTPTISAFSSLDGEVKSRATVAVEVSHEDNFSAY